MSEDQSLGKLESVPLREAWKSESEDFSRWLAEEKNLAFLGETLDMGLEFDTREKDVGPFRADIVCRDEYDGSCVVIENQLEKANHRHLGQLLTYAAWSTYATGSNAVTAIWIAAEFTEQHRAALDWLNKITESKFRFFGLEIKLWKIGDSPAAPKFNIVSKPDDWSRSELRRARFNKRGELTSKKSMQITYWEGLKEALNRRRGTVRFDRSPLPESRAYLKLGRSDFRLRASMIQGEGIKAEVYIRGVNVESFFALLYKQREEIEKNFGDKLEWRRSARKAEIGIVRKSDPENRKDWRQQHDWLAERLNDLHRVFANRVKELDIDGRDDLETDGGSGSEKVS